jgi:dienelactone hydrolase
LEWDNGAGATVPAYLVVPDRVSTPAPGLLLHHWHGGQYALGKDQVLAPWPPGGSFADAAAERGWIVLAIDAYAFGERRFQGPAGAREEGHATETSLFKMLLWQGRTLWGMMIRDDAIALGILSSLPEVDPARIGALGASMGSTRTWWLAALDDRVRVSVCTVCLTRYEELIARGLLAEHGIYYFVPGLLREFDTEGVVSLIAPRPLLTLSGADDTGSPVVGVRKINSFCERVYALHGCPERLRGVVYDGVGHEYTPEMWRETFAWLERWLA